MRKQYVLIGLSAGMLSLALFACHAGRNNPGRIYAPDMYYSRAYNSYSVNLVYADSMSSRLPVPGTVPRGHTVNAHELLPFNLPQSDSAYAVSGQVKNPLPVITQATLEEGQRLFNIYCAICHGEQLDGQGPLYKSGKFPVQPANFHLPQYLNMPEGTMFYSVTYGKNLMGSYASQLSERQRWEVIAYIKSVQAKDLAKGTDSTAVAKK
ncbi:c-type cytochrome [Thermoflavifilum thermophilum]|nr:cytochrome c [Thermoflavifilum thermophilum]